jgi:hypothetical protein
VQDLPAEPGVPVDQLPASELGLTCLVAPAADSLTIEATVRFALYLQHYPTYEEQFRHAALTADDYDPASDAEASPEAREETPPEPGSQELKRGRQAAAPLLSGPLAGPVARPGSREVSDAALLVFQRYDVSAPIRLTVPVPGDSIPVTVDDKGKLVAAAGHAIESEAVASRPGTSGGPYRLLTSPAQRIPREAMADPDTFDQWLSANAQPGWTPPTAQPKFTATAHRDPSGQVRLALTLANAALRPERDHGLLADVSVYDAAFEATVSGGSLVNMGYRMIDADYRTNPEVYAHGRFCCLDDDASAPASGRLVTTAFPVFRQFVYESRDDLEPTYRELAHDPVPALRRIAEHMQEFLGQWDTYLAADPLPSASALAQCRADRDTFAHEHARFTTGIDLIDADLSSPSPGGLGTAFCWMNEAMRRMDAPGGVYTPTGPPKVRSWRLFQIVFIVIHLAALAAREPSGSLLIDELSYADILWFPTGGGKSAALY